MATKLSDAELGARVRAANRVRAIRQRERLVERGKVALTTWVTSSLRDSIQETASREGATIGETINRLLKAGLTARATPISDTLPLIEPVPTERARARPSAVEAPVDREGMMLQIAAMLNAEPGIEGAELARRLTTAGFKARNGELKR